MASGISFVPKVQGIDLFVSSEVGQHHEDGERPILPVGIGKETDITATGTTETFEAACELDVSRLDLGYD